MPKNQSDFETEPDYTIMLRCTHCGDVCEVSGQIAEFYEIDNTNYVCVDCNYLYD